MSGDLHQSGLGSIENPLIHGWEISTVRVQHLFLTCVVFSFFSLLSQIPLEILTNPPFSFLDWSQVRLADRSFGLLLINRTFTISQANLFTTMVYRPMSRSSYYINESLSYSYDSSALGSRYGNANWLKYERKS